MDAVELAVQVAVTEAFIATRPVALTLVPHEKVSDGSGGFRLVPQPPRTPQQMRFVESAGSDISPTEIGEQFRERATLLGMPDAAIAVNDEFEWDGSTWKVIEMLFPNGYEVRATVARYGR